MREAAPAAVVFWRWGMCDYRELRTVFRGPLPEATVVRSLLEARGIEAFIESEHAKTTFPFITGVGALEVEVLCPADRAEEARGVIAAARADG